MSLTVYLADLRYNYTGFLANDCMPLAVGYMKAYMDQHLPDISSRLFAYPDRLWNAMLDKPPDVLMVSNYCWNEALSLHFGKLAKRLRPSTLVVMGGPNLSLEPERQIDYVRDHPEIDVYALGEGDFLAAEIVKLFLQSDRSLDRFGENLIPSSVYRSPDGNIRREPSWARHKIIDEIPSPWLSGILDEFFDGKLAPLMETNRGCPFTCSFCVQGTNWYTKVHNFSLDRIREELTYIAERIQSTCPQMGTLRIADSNYGMFERDIEISSHIGELQKAFKWPTYIDATTGKNRADRIIRSVEKVSGALVLYQAVQSLDENVLRNVKRQTIKIQAYEQILAHIRGRGLRSNSDLILGLPGDSLATHVAGLHKLLDSGVSQVTNFQLMMLKGSELETMESRRLFRFDTRFRVLPKNFGIYGDRKVFDVEEIVVASDSLSFEDYLQARKYALVSAAFWHNGDFDEALTFAEGLGVKRSAWLDSVLHCLETATGPLREYLVNFVEATKRELFPSREACIAFYSNEVNFRRLLDGELGENLMHKHNALACFHLWPHICQAAMNVTGQLLVDAQLDTQIPDFTAFWHDFAVYMEARHAWGYTEEQILSSVSAVLRYDIESWLNDRSPINPAPYRLPEPILYTFMLPETSKRYLAKALEVWTTDIKGLTKMVTRIQVNWLRRTPMRTSSVEVLETADVL